MLAPPDRSIFLGKHFGRFDIVPSLWLKHVDCIFRFGRKIWLVFVLLVCPPVE